MPNHVENKNYYYSLRINAQSASEPLQQWRTGGWGAQAGAPARIWTRVGKIQLKKKSARSAEKFFDIAHPVF